MSGTSGAFVESFLLAVFARDPFITSRIDLPRILARIADSVARLPALHRTVFRVSVILMEYALPPVAWKLRPFSRLPHAVQTEYLEAWKSSRFQWKRNLFRLVKSVCVCSLLAEDAVLEQIGYGPSLRHRRERA